MHLYIHIPFCKQACHYCDFHFSTNLSTKTAMVEAVCKEIELQKDYLNFNRQIETIYFGGGTPSLLSESELAQIFETIDRYFSVSPNAEITLEANPDDLAVEKLKMFRKYVNRLSIGIQSFDDGFLKYMNRAHNATESENCVKQAQAVGFEDISIDLMYGFGDISADLEKALSLNVPHISAYCLTIEPKTVLGKWLKSKQIKPIDEEKTAAHFETLVAILTQNGYEHYEISNFAKPNRYARHNSSYWKRKPYLGIGPSAHSYNGRSRQYNISNNGLYIKSLAKNTIPFEIEILTKIEQANDYILTSLRTIWGCELGILNEIVGQDFYMTQQKTIEKLFKIDWLLIENNTIFLTQKGKLFADRAASELFLE